MNQMRLYTRRYIFAVWALVLLCCGMAQAADEATNDAQSLKAKHEAISSKLAKNQFGAPIYLESKESSGSVKVDMYGVFNYPFNLVQEALGSPANWCDVTFQHLNIKACVWGNKGDDSTVTLYSGRKFYQPPSDGYPLKFKFRTLAKQPQYLDLSLTAKEGPLGTKNHDMRLQAIPLDRGKTFVHFSYAYSNGTMARMATRSYLSTIGKDKVGFSIIRKGGKSSYVGGSRGAIERNTMRYYLALQSYIDTLKVPESQRFEQRISRWYDLTAKYPQLKENEKGEYLANKKKERANQISLQNKEGG